MRLDDFIMLGTTVPEDSKRYGRKVCSAGYSPELRSLIRIYPLGLRHAPKRWTQNTVHVQRNTSDSRPESWALADRADRNTWNMNEAFHPLRRLTPHEHVDLCDEIDANTPNSIAEANDQRASLTLIRPKALNFHWAKTRPHLASDVMQMQLFETHANTRAPEHLPRIEFTDDDGTHDLQIREWGAYELIRRRGNAYACEHLEGALKLDSNTDDVGLLVGNMNNHRTSWLVISVLTGLASQPALFQAKGKCA